MTEYEKGYIEGMEQAKRVCTSYVQEHLQDGRKLERALGASAIVYVLGLQIAASKRETKENENA